MNEGVGNLSHLLRHQRIIGVSEKKFEIKTVGVDYVCDQCGDGVMVANGSFAPMSDPPQWQPLVQQVRIREAFFEKYPTLRFERAA